MLTKLEGKIIDAVVGPIRETANTRTSNFRVEIYCTFTYVQGRKLTTTEIHTNFTFLFMANADHINFSIFFTISFHLLIQVSSFTGDRLTCC